MIALIQVPHQRPARIQWYSDRESLHTAALETAGESIDCIVEPDSFDDAVSYLASDWHTHLLIESADDLADVEKYNGHQKQKVRAMLDELRETFDDASGRFPSDP